MEFSLVFFYVLYTDLERYRYISLLSYALVDS
jgi:hypothetical protein